MATPRTILFLCTGNACRSQLAEALFTRLASPRYHCVSAGVAPAGYVHRSTVQVLEEVGIDWTTASSKSLSSFASEPPTVTVSLCKHATSKYRKFALDRPLVRLHVLDPSLVNGSSEERITAFRWVRDQICLHLEDALQEGKFDHDTAPRALDRGLGLLRRCIPGARTPR